MSEESYLSVDRWCKSGVKRERHAVWFMHCFSNILFIFPAVREGAGYLFVLLRSYDHSLDPESGSDDEVGGRHHAFFGGAEYIAVFNTHTKMGTGLKLNASA